MPVVSTRTRLFIFWKTSAYARNDVCFRKWASPVISETHQSGRVHSHHSKSVRQPKEPRKRSQIAWIAHFVLNESHHSQQPLRTPDRTIQTIHRLIPCLEHNAISEQSQQRTISRSLSVHQLRRRTGTGWATWAYKWQSSTESTLLAWFRASIDVAADAFGWTFIAIDVKPECFSAWRSKSSYTWKSCVDKDPCHLGQTSNRWTSEQGLKPMFECVESSRQPIHQPVPSADLSKHGCEEYTAAKHAGSILVSALFAEYPSAVDWRFVPWQRAFAKAKHYAHVLTVWHHSRVRDDGHSDWSRVDNSELYCGANWMLGP